jgi:hypothetical protein
VPIVLKSGSLNLLESSGPVKGCNGIALSLRLLETQRDCIATYKELTQQSVTTKQILQLDASLSHGEIYLESFERRELMAAPLFQFAVQRHVRLALRWTIRQMNSEM